MTASRDEAAKTLARAGARLQPADGVEQRAARASSCRRRRRRTSGRAARCARCRSSTWAACSSTTRSIGTSTRSIIPSAPSPAAESRRRGVRHRLRAMGVGRRACWRRRSVAAGSACLRSHRGSRSGRSSCSTTCGTRTTRSARCSWADAGCSSTCRLRSQWRDRFRQRCSAGSFVLLSYLVGLTYVAKQETLSAFRISGRCLFARAVRLRAAGWPTCSPSHLGSLLLPSFLAWVAAAVLAPPRARPGQHPRAVIRLIAGISLLDALLLVSHTSSIAAAVAVACFAATMMLQRYVRGRSASESYMSSAIG